MADFQGKYNGDQIEQLLDKANDIDLSKYALKTDNAPTATKLQAARTIALSGAVTGSASSDFGSNITISTTLANFDASKITSGTISIDRLPKASFANLVRDRDDDDKFAILWNFSSDDDLIMRNICHESFHIAMSVCQFCNMSLGFKVGEDEHAAYIAGFAGDCVSEFINSKNTD